MLARAGRATVDGVLFDLGVSSPQLDEAERGFAYSYDAPLDMRMDTDQELTAEKVVNTYSAAELIRILRDYGEERFAPRVARLIIKERAKDPITSTKRLAEIVRQAIPAATRRTGGNPAKRTFQALRIEVNAELAALEAALPAALDALVARWASRRALLPLPGGPAHQAGPHGANQGHRPPRAARPAAGSSAAVPPGDEGSRAPK